MIMDICSYKYRDWVVLVEPHLYRSLVQLCGAMGVHFTLGTTSLNMVFLHVTWLSCNITLAG